MRILGSLLLVLLISASVGCTQAQLKKADHALETAEVALTRIAELSSAVETLSGVVGELSTDEHVDDFAEEGRGLGGSVAGGAALALAALTMIRGVLKKKMEDS